MKDITKNNELYGAFEITIADRKLSVEPGFSQNHVYYRICERKQFLFTLRLDDNGQWKAENEETDPVDPQQPVNQAFARLVGQGIEKLTT